MVYLRYIQIHKWWKGMTHVYLIQQNKYTICQNKRAPVILKKRHIEIESFLMKCLIALAIFENISK